MAWVTKKTSNKYCNLTNVDITKIQKDGTGTSEELEFGKVVLYNLTTKCKIN
ncbi:hypothetical protein ABIB30_000848 [Pedobacter sp. UYP1]